VELSERTRYTPSVRFLVLVVQRLDLLCLFGSAEPGRVAEFEELGCVLDEPARVNSGHLSHVLFGGHDQLVVDDPAKKKTVQSLKTCTFNMLAPFNRNRNMVGDARKIHSQL